MSRVRKMYIEKIAEQIQEDRRLHGLILQDGEQHVITPLDDPEERAKAIEEGRVGIDVPCMPIADMDRGRAAPDAWKSLLGENYNGGCV